MCSIFSENLMKRILSCLATGGILVGAVGCGDSGVTEGTVQFKATDTSGQNFESMKKFMMGQVKGPTPKKSAEASKKAEPAADKAPEAEKKD
jgi:hypothetical protein